MSEEKKCITCECSDCKAKFQVWLDESFKTPETEVNKDPEIEEKIKKRILMHCPVCKPDKDG